MYLMYLVYLLYLIYLGYLVMLYLIYLVYFSLYVGVDPLQLAWLVIDLSLAIGILQYRKPATHITFQTQGEINPSVKQVKAELASQSSAVSSSAG